MISNSESNKSNDLFIKWYWVKIVWSRSAGAHCSFASGTKMLVGWITAFPLRMVYHLQWFVITWFKALLKFRLKWKFCLKFKKRYLHLCQKWTPKFQANGECLKIGYWFLSIVNKNIIICIIILSIAIGFFFIIKLLHTLIMQLMLLCEVTTITQSYIIYIWI